MKLSPNCILLILFTFVNINATTINVPEDSSAIQSGIDGCSNGDTVLVQPGTYVENINFNGKNIVVGSLFLTTGDTSFISSTIIDGNQNGSVVTFENGEDFTAQLIGFKITNGYNLYGGGIKCYSSSPKFDHLIVTGNTASNGGGFNISYSNCEISNTIIQNNAGDSYGAGIYCHTASPLIRNVKIKDNINASRGGGIYCETNSSPILENVLIVNNGDGGGIHCRYSSNLQMINCNIIGNDTYGVFAYDSDLNIVNSIIWSSGQAIQTDFGTVSVTHSLIEGGYSGVNVIDVDPLFTDIDNYVFSLQDYSPCIGAGIDTTIIPITDIEGNPRPNPAGSNPDMGAYENPFGTPQHMPIKINIPADYATIQAGIDAAVDGDTVLVQQGTYVENINFNGKNIVVGSLYLTTSDTSYISSTIIDGNESGSTVTMLSTSSIAEFVGFNVINGFSASGGGIEINGNGSKIRGVVVRNNTAGSGAGVMISGGTPEFDNVKIVNNIATGNYGGGIYCAGGNAVFKNSIISGNTGSNGGGVACFDSDPVFTNVLIHSNSASKGGGILCEYSSAPILTNVTIANNSASLGGGSLYSRADAIISVNNSILWSVNSSEIETETGGSVTISYSNVKNGYTGTGNVDSDPLLYDAANGDYRLSDYSPCIGAGLDTSIVPSTDIEGNPRPNPPGSNPDMGAYENILGIPITAEVEDLDIGLNEDLQHIITHEPIITFTYSNSSGGLQIQYQIQVSTVSDFSSIDMWDTGEVTSSYTSVDYTGSELIDGSTYYMRAGVSNGQSWSNWASLSFRMNSIPSVPSLTSPINNQVVNEPILLTINSSEDPEDDLIQYVFYVFDDNSRQVFVDSSGLVADTTWIVQEPLADNNQYWWYAKAYDGYEYSDLAIAESFLVNTENNVPTEFSLLSPGINEEISTLLPTFIWNSSFDPDPLDTIRYTLYLDTPEPGVLAYEAGLDTTWQVMDPLLDNQEYFWKVIASDILDFEMENIGGYRRFSTNQTNENPSVVNLVSPDSVICVDLEVNLYWTPAIDPDPNDIITYEVHWDGEFMQPQSLETDTNSCIITNVVDNAKHHWYVISKDQHGGTSESRHAPFWVDATPEPPLSFTTVSPSNNETGLDNEVTFIWNKAIDPDPFDHVSYYISYWSDSLPVEHIPEIMDTSIVVSIPEDGTYYWMITAYDEDNFYVESNDSVPSIFTVGFVNIADDVLIPEVFTLHQNYPNPFNPITTLRYDLPENSFVNITIYDMLGRQVRTLVNQTQDAGFKSVIWNATNDQGNLVSAGVYLYQIQAGEYVQTKKMVVLK